MRNFAKLAATLGLPDWDAEGPKHLDAQLPGPYDPWQVKVMVLAGWAQGIPWLYLACRDCEWWLGYHAQFDPAALAEAAKAHEECCEVPDAT